MAYTSYQKKKEFDEKWRGVEVLDGEVKEEMDRLTRGSMGMNEKRMQLLDAEGFVWDPLEAQWFERLQELKDYKMTHGDTLVPKVYPANPSLGLWVGNQRTTYTIYQKKKEFDEKWSGVEVLDDEVKEEMDRLTRRLNGMNEKRVQLLEAEGFVWDVPAHIWESRFQELRAFVALNGHAAIYRRKRGPYDLLATWASTQRRNYIKRQNGQLLDSVGFAWGKYKNTRVRRTLC
ncbi:hypothetical protein ACHAW5_004900 [Stephanodiscus triporus]|uniref:Helicase-associated domain-containing protein n=1 Tax=Stephanodiscus triporus TaxID=2934178 RepID=A0ABD3NZJ1_9STRA